MNWILCSCHGIKIYPQATFNSRRRLNLGYTTMLHDLRTRGATGSTSHRGMAMVRMEVYVRSLAAGNNVLC